jgi:hypothetical protein
MVVSAVAQRVSLPFCTEKTSAAATDSVRPDLRNFYLLRFEARFKIIST